jgi:hypothetical protein
MFVESRPGQGSTFSFTLPPANPIKVLEHYLGMPSASRTDLARVSLVAVNVEEYCEEPQAVEINDLLHDVLRGGDLVLWTAPSNWLLVLDASQGDCKEVMRRVIESHKEGNRNLPNDQLPPITMSPQGTWFLAADREAFMSRVQEELALAKKRGQDSFLETSPDLGCSVCR